MSYTAAVSLQEALYETLRTDPIVLNSLTDGTQAIFDRPPRGEAPEIFISLGVETVTAVQDRDSAGARHEFELLIGSETRSFLALKQLASRVSVLLDGPQSLSLSTGTLKELRFHKAEARRASSEMTRGIRLIFRAYIDAL